MIKKKVIVSSKSKAHREKISTHTQDNVCKSPLVLAPQTAERWLSTTAASLRPRFAERKQRTEQWLAQGHRVSRRLEGKPLKPRSREARVREEQGWAGCEAGRPQAKPHY